MLGRSNHFRLTLQLFKSSVDFLASLAYDSEEAMPRNPNSVLSIILLSKPSFKFCLNNLIAQCG